MTECVYTLALCLEQTLGRVDEWYQRGLVSAEIVEAYIERWNEGPHLSTAVLRDGAIRLTHIVEPTRPIHKAAPVSEDLWHCETCGQRIRRVPGGHGPTWVHSDSGAVVAPDPRRAFTEEREMP